MLSRHCIHTLSLPTVRIIHVLVDRLALEMALFLGANRHQTPQRFLNRQAHLGLRLLLFAPIEHQLFLLECRQQVLSRFFDLLSLLLFSFSTVYLGSTYSRFANLARATIKSSPVRRPTSDPIASWPASTPSSTSDWKGASNSANFSCWL